MIELKSCPFEEPTESYIIKQPQEQTNEEWLRSCSTEELAEIIYDLLITAKPLSWSNKLHIRVLRDVYEHGNERSTMAIIEWLQEKHNV